MPINNEDIEKHPWLRTWDKIDDKERLEVLKDRMIEIDDILGTSSVILITLILILLGIAFFILLSEFTSGSITMSQVNQLGGFVKQFTGK
jgi:hypothetical protein